jgi:hypothetical protein
VQIEAASGLDYLARNIVSDQCGQAPGSFEQLRQVDAGVPLFASVDTSLEFIVPLGAAVRSLYPQPNCPSWSGTPEHHRPPATSRSNGSFLPLRPAVIVEAGWMTIECDPANRIRHQTESV